MKGKFTKTNLKVEINSDDRFVIDKSNLWCEVNKVFFFVSCYLKVNESRNNY